MNIFKKVSHSVLLSMALVNLALADDVMPVSCPLPKDIQTPPAQDSKEHSIPKLKCMNDACVWEQTNRFGTDLHWHFYIHPQGTVSKDNVVLNKQMQEVLSSLAYLSGPIEEKPYAFVCRYSNSLNFTALAVYTKEVRCPTPTDIEQQKENGQSKCDWFGNCAYSLQNRFDSDFDWNFLMKLRAWSQSDATSRVYRLLPLLTYGKSINPAYKAANPIKVRGNLYVCQYHTFDGYEADATYSSYD